MKVIQHRKSRGRSSQTDGARSGVTHIVEWEGGRYNVYSPDQGWVISGPDTIAFWQSAFVAGMGNAGTTSEQMVGFFTQRQVLSFAPSVTVLDTWVTDGGGHMLNATRMDFMPVGSSWAFLSSFRRESAGLTRVEPDWVTGY